MTRTKTTTTDTTNAEPQAASPPVTFSLEALNKAVAEAVAIGLAKQQAEQVTQAISAKAAGKSERSMLNEIAVVKAFKAKGFGNVTPHVDVMTFNRWMAKGYRPIEGSKSLKIKNLRLFHVSQVRQLTVEEKAATQQQSDAAVARHMVKVIPINAEANPQ